MGRWGAVLAALAAGCTFNAAVPEGAVVRCGGDADCPSGQRCRASTATCRKAEGFDDTPPALVPGSLRLSFVAAAMGLLENPTALGRNSEARIAFQTTEPLEGVPALVTAPALACFARTTSLDSFEFGCTLPAAFAGPDGPVQLEARLQDVALNTAQVPLGVQLSVDTSPPPSPVVEGAGGLVLVRSPWGSIASGGAAEDALEGPPGAAPEAVVLLARTGLTPRGVLPVEPDGSVRRAALSRLNSSQVQVLALDGAGNPSAELQLKRGRWIASFDRAGAQGLGAPHQLLALPAAGATPERDARARAALPTGEVRAAPAWRQLGASLPEALGNPVVAYDVARGRTVRFGGVLRQRVFVPLLGQFIEVGPPLGLPDVFETAGTGWVTRPVSDPELDANPPGRIDAVAAASARRAQLFLQGGSGPNPTPNAADPTDGPLLGDTWAYTGTSWRRLAEGPARRGAVAWFDEEADALVVAGGQGDAGVLDDAWALGAAGWSRLPWRLPEGAAWAAAARATRSGRTLLFGGRGSNGRVSAALVDVTSGAPVAVAPDGGAWPAPRSHAAAAFIDDDEFFLAGGLGADGGVLTDAWGLRDGQWQPRPALPRGLLVAGDAGELGARPSVVWESARDTLVLNVGSRTATRGSGPTAAWVDRTAVDLPGRWHPPLACAPALRGCVTFSSSPFAAYRLDAFGWQLAQELTVGPAPTAWKEQLATAWDPASATLVALPYEGPTHLWSADAGWSRTPFKPVNRDYGIGSTLAATREGVLFVSTTRQGVFHTRIDSDGNACQPPTGCPVGTPEFEGPPCNGPAGVVSRWAADGGWRAFGALDSRSTPDGGALELNWAQVLPFPAAPPQVLGLQLTRALGVLVPNTFWGAQLWAPAAAATFSQRWALDGGAWPGQGDLSALSAIGAAAPNPERGTVTLYGGLSTGSNRASSVTYELTPAGGALRSTAAVDGFGAPSGRVAPALAWDPVRRATVLLGGGASSEDWGFWQTASTTPTIEQINARRCLESFNPFGLPCTRLPFLRCLKELVSEVLPAPPTSDTWALSELLERPALEGRVDLDAALLPGETAIARVTVRARASASSDAAGVRAAWWNVDRWEVGPVAQGAALELSVEVARPLRSLRSGAGLYVKLEPAGTNSTGAATLTATELEVELEYSLR